MQNYSDAEIVHVYVSWLSLLCKNNTWELTWCTKINQCDYSYVCTNWMCYLHPAFAWCLPKILDSYSKLHRGGNSSAASFFLLWLLLLFCFMVIFSLWSFIFFCKYGSCNRCDCVNMKLNWLSLGNISQNWIFLVAFYNCLWLPDFCGVLTSFVS